MAMRHTEVVGNNPTHYDTTGQCRGESMLTHKGRSQAQQIRALFEAAGVRPHVIHSPMCRTTETAQLAFPNSTHHTDPALREIASADAAQRQAFLQAATRLLREAPKDRLVVFIGHAPNLFALTLEDFGYGVGLLGRIAPEGDIAGETRISLYPSK
jgi:phosphohistidine phosphatase SixA